MHKKKQLFWSQSRQRIKFTINNHFEGVERYSFIGWCSQLEMELLVDILFERFGDDFISSSQIMTVFQNFMHCISKLKRITDDNDICI